VKSRPPLPQPMPAFALRLGYGQSELLRCVSSAGSSREIDNGCGFRTIDSVLINRDTPRVGFNLFRGLT
jgi:hypothetical protein